MITLLLSLLLTVWQVNAACNDWAGATGVLSELQHQVAGRVTIKDDCTLLFEGFSYDGTGPDVFVWGVKGSGSLRNEGVALGSVPKRRFANECYAHTLSGADLDQIANGDNSVLLSIWCRAFSANFGSVTLTKPTTPTNVGAAKCTDGCEEWVGATGTIQTLQHQVAGTVKVKGDCSIQIDDFSYDGAGPDVFVWGTSGTGDLSQGVNLGPVPKQAFSSECYSHKLAGATLTELAAGSNGVKLSIWCRQFGANFGQVVLNKPATPQVLPEAKCVVSDGCSNWIGATGTITTKAHKVAGTVKVMKDCSLQIDDFSYDGTGPDVFLWGTSSTGNLNNGVSLGAVPKTAFDSECYAHKITGSTLDQLANGSNGVKLSVWCRQFSANFGDVVLTKPTAPQDLPEAKCVVSDGCSNWVGAMGTIVTKGHQVAGTVKVMKDCSIQIDDFSYDGTGPDVFIWGTSASGSLNNGVSLGPVPKQAYNNECYAHKLTGNTLDQLANGSDGVKLSVWCRQFSANFGDVVLTKPASPLGNVPVASCTVSPPANNNCPARFPNCLKNCQKLDSYFYVWYEVKGDMIEIELEADVEEGSWVGFGVADENNYGMIGSDVAITGFFTPNGVGVPQAMAKDYYLTQKTQCNYNAGANRGVCPDDNIDVCPNANGATGNNDITLISGERVNNLQRIRYKRKLDTQDVCDRSFAGGRRRVVWGTGPITQSNTLVVNIHDIPNKPGRGGHSPATGDSTYFNAMENPGYGACADAPKQTTATAMPVTPFCVGVVHDQTVIDMEVKNHLPHEYPDLPAWGVSWAVGDLKTPEIFVRRGTEYTFNVVGGPAHPFYITDDARGGRQNKDEKIFYGDENAIGTEETPLVVKWTPDASTPDMVYYQCWTHQKLGWRIHVVDADAPLVLPQETAVCEDIRRLFAAPTTTTANVATTTAENGETTTGAEGATTTAADEQATTTADEQATTTETTMQETDDDVTSASSLSLSLAVIGAAMTTLFEF